MLATLFALVSGTDYLDAAFDVTLKAHEISMPVDFSNMTFSGILRVSEVLKVLFLRQSWFRLESQ